MFDEMNIMLNADQSLPRYLSTWHSMHTHLASIRNQDVLTYVYAHDLCHKQNKLLPEMEIQIICCHFANKIILKYFTSHTVKHFKT
jgi:hypothetical protein